jgi:hypothetical protein
MYLLSAKGMAVPLTTTKQMNPEENTEYNPSQIIDPLNFSNLFI